MVPVLEVQHIRSVPATSEAMEFPTWTRDDDGDNENPHVGLRRDTHRSRSRFNKRSLSLTPGQRERSAHAKRDKDDSAGSSSDDKAKGTDKKKKKKNEDVSPPPIIQQSTPDASPPAPTAVTQRPSPSRPPPKLAPLQTSFQPTATIVAPSDGQFGDLPRPVNNADNHPDSASQGEPPSPKSPKFQPPPFTLNDGLMQSPSAITANPAPDPSKARKGLEPASPTGAPVVTVTEQEDQTSKTLELPQAIATSRPDPGREDRTVEGNLHAKTEDALIAVGSVGATIIAFFVFWLAWRCYKIQKRKRAGEPPGRVLDFDSTMNKPKQLIVGLASRIPVLRERAAERSWANIDKPYDEAYWEKNFPVSRELSQGSAKGIHVHTAITTRSDPESQSDMSLPFQAPQHSLIPPQVPPKPGTRSRHHLSGISDASSLSSGFGDGDIIMPTAYGAAHTTLTTITADPLAVPPPVAQRDSIGELSARRETVYTEASEDPLPRFRTVNSWVRQQTSRIKRANQRDTAASDAPPVPSLPPEQDFRLMMPDEEEPRRVEDASAETGHVDHGTTS